MIINMYSIHDIKAGVYFPMQGFVNDNVAQRGIRADVLRNPTSLVAMYPTDYRLYRVGRFDDSAGVMLPDVNPKMVAELSAILEVPKENEES